MKEPTRPARDAAEAPIRPAREADLALLLRMLAEFHREEGYPLDEAAAARALDALVSDPSLGRLWLVLADGAPVGYVAVAFGFSLEYLGRDAFIDDLFIRPAFRGRGLGSQVLAAVEPACRALGVRTLHLEVERRNLRAQALYRRHGFRDNDRQLLSKRLLPPA